MLKSMSNQHIPSILSDVVRPGLCSGCGVCVAACPAGTLEMNLSAEGTLLPTMVNGKNCLGCGLCEHVCAGQLLAPYCEGFAAKQTGETINQPNVYLGYAETAETRKKGSSGGVAGALLLKLLADHMIDGAVVTVPNQNNCFVCQTVLAKRPDRIKESQGSRYTQVDYSQGLRELKAAKGGRYAVVGLPCHLAGLRKWMETVPDIHNKIYLLIGLFCGRGASIDFSKFGAICQDIRPAEVSSIEYRSGQWSRFGFMYRGSFGQKWMQFSGTPIGLAWSTYQFCPVRCLSCGDGFAIGSDVALGDAWNLVGGDSSYGTSLIIANTQIGFDVVQRMAGQGVLNLTLTDPQDIQVSQAPIVSFKIRTLKPRLRILRLFGYRVPEDERKLDSVTVRIRDVVNACRVLVLYVLGRELHRRGYFQKRPTKTFCMLLKIAQRIGDYLA
jgi:coenzyme F420 hydrogenase subunit beta